MGSRSHLVGKGAMKEHLAYQQSVRRSVRAAAALTDMLGGVPPPCKACKGKPQDRAYFRPPRSRGQAKPSPARGAGYLGGTSARHVAWSI